MAQLNGGLLAMADRPAANRLDVLQRRR